MRGGGLLVVVVSEPCCCCCLPFCLRCCEVLFLLAACPYLVLSITLSLSPSLPTLRAHVFDSPGYHSSNIPSTVQVNGLAGAKQQRQLGASSLDECHWVFLSRLSGLTRYFLPTAASARSPLHWRHDEQNVVSHCCPATKLNASVNQTPRRTA